MEVAVGASNFEEDVEEVEVVDVVFASMAERSSYSVKNPEPPHDVVGSAAQGEEQKLGSTGPDSLDSVKPQ